MGSCDFKEFWGVDETMIIYPAIDIRNGNCVRLREGKAEAETVYSSDPVAMALKWQEAGAQWLHVVDLDGAFEGKPRNQNIVKQIIAETGLLIQYGGGLRTLKAAEEMLAIGVSRVVLGTIAVTEPNFVKKLCNKYPGKIAVGIDANDGYVAIKGWVDKTGKKALDLAKEMIEVGVSSIIYTDIKRDGTLKGPNLNALISLSQKIDIPVIASGGVSSMEDIINIKGLDYYGVEGVIVGKALYDETVDLKEAICISL